MKNNNNLTKKNIINKLRINKIRYYLKDPNITKKQLSYALKDKLLSLLSIQNLIVSGNIFFNNLPLDLQRKIIEYL